MELNKDILDAFSIKPKNIRKSKGLYIIETINEKYTIRTIKSNENFIIQSQKIIKYLEQNNLYTTDKYKLTTDEKPYLTYKGDTYVVSQYLPLKINDFNNSSNLLKTTQELAKFHKSVKITDINIDPSKNLILDFKETLKDIQNIKKRVIKQKNLKDFDLDFLKSSNIYLEKIEQTIENLNTEYYENRFNSTINNHSISHSNIKEENFELFKSDIYINNFTKIAINDQLFDVALLIQRFLKSKVNNSIKFDDVINEYLKQNQISDKDIEIVKTLCLYPKRYVKTITTYYSKNRTFTPTGLYSKLQDEINKLYDDDFYK